MKTTETTDRFHIVTDFDDGTSISTILLYNPYRPVDLYETCIFYSNGDSDVVQTYETEARARKGHAMWVEATKARP